MKKRKIKLLSICATAILSVGLFAGCGSSGSKQEINVLNYGANAAEGVFEEFEKEQKSKDNDQLKKCLTELSNFKTLDKTDKFIFITKDRDIIGKTNLNSIKTLFECNFITKRPYNETYLNKTYTGFTYVNNGVQ